MRFCLEKKKKKKKTKKKLSSQHGTGQQGYQQGCQQGRELSVSVVVLVEQLRSNGSGAARQAVQFKGVLDHRI